MVNYQIDAQFFLCVYFNSLHVSSNLLLIIRRINFINTTSGICQYVSVTDSCAGRRPAHEMVTYIHTYIQKYIEKNYASIWSFTMKHNSNHTEVYYCPIFWDSSVHHGTQNLDKIRTYYKRVTPS